MTKKKTNRTHEQTNMPFTVITSVGVVSLPWGLWCMFVLEGADERAQSLSSIACGLSRLSQQKVSVLMTKACLEKVCCGWVCLTCGYKSRLTSLSLIFPESGVKQNFWFTTDAVSNPTRQAHKSSLSMKGMCVLMTQVYRWQKAVITCSLHYAA